jgi:hypothetical protein
MGRAEATVEDYLRGRVKALGGEVRKVLYQGRRGALDAWCFLPGGRLIIVECKRPSRNKLDPLQEDELAWLLRMGFKATWVNSKEQVDEILRSV